MVGKIKEEIVLGSILKSSSHLNMKINLSLEKLISTFATATGKAVPKG